MKYNCAVVGLGNIGFKFSLDETRKGVWSHVDAYNRCSLTNLTAVVETMAENKDIFTKEYPNIPVYDTVKELFEKHNIDMVSICVPTDKHFEVFQEVMEYDVRSIFCEKPLSYFYDEAKKMVKMAEEKGVILAVNYSRRWQSSYRVAAEMIKRGDIGKITAINAFYPAHIYNVGSHMIDTILMCSNLKPGKVSAIMVGSEKKDPSLSGWIKCKEDIVVTFSATGEKNNLIFEVDVLGAEGRVRIKDNGGKIDFFKFKESNRYSGYRELVLHKFNMPEENDRFIDAVSNVIKFIETEGKDAISSTGESALLVDSIISKAISSSQLEGVPQSVENEGVGYVA